MILLTETSRRLSGLAGRVRYTAVRASQVKNTVTGLSRASLGGSDGERFVVEVLAAGGAIQEMIEAAQVRERHVDLRRGGQLRRSRTTSDASAIHRRRGCASAG